MEYNKWTKVAVCKCGFIKEAPFGSLFHIHFTVCPDCGEDKDKMELKTAMYKSNWFRGEWIFKDEK